MNGKAAAYKRNEERGRRRASFTRALACEERRAGADTMKFFHSFQNALKGLLYCLQYERNFRIHLVVAFYTTCFSVLYRLTAPEYALLICVFGLVLFGEAVNTAFEVLIDMNSPTYNPMAKLSKDIAAGAVLVICIFAVVVGFGLFRDFRRTLSVFATVFTTPWLLAAFVVSAALSALFIWGKLTNWLLRKRSR